MLQGKTVTGRTAKLIRMVHRDPGLLTWWGLHSVSEVK